MLSPLMILILAGLTIGAILLVSGYLMFMDGANDYKNPELTRDYHSSRDVMSERGKSNRL